MLEGLFTITRDFEMPTQPHLLLLQKTMVMEEGVATFLDPDINMWAAAEPFLREWIRDELGPEAYAADRLIHWVRTFKKLPDLVARLDHYFPAPGAAPPPLPPAPGRAPSGSRRAGPTGPTPVPPPPAPRRRRSPMPKSKSSGCRACASA